MIQSIVTLLLTTITFISSTAQTTVNSAKSALNITQIITSPTPSPVPTPTPIQYFEAKGEIKEQQYEAEITLKFPQSWNGGSVTGTISGDCNGSISGEYNGTKGDTSRGKMSGQSSGRCLIFFPFEATFSGWASPVEDKIVALSVTAKSGDISINRTITLPIINPVIKSE